MILLTFGLMVGVMVSALKILTYHYQPKLNVDDPFECGVSSFFSSRKFYSMVFFFLTLIFLLFDIEIILIMPMAFSNFKFMALTSILIFMYLLGYLIEWSMQSMEWMSSSKSM